MSQSDLAFVSSEFDVIAPKPVQHAIQELNVTVCKSIAPTDQSDLEFLIRADSDTYVDPDIKIYIRGKFAKADATELDTTDYTAGATNFLHSLFSQCTIAVNGVNITHSGYLYNYRTYLETLLSYGVDASISHLTNSYWYKDVGICCIVNPQMQSRKRRNSLTGGTDRNSLKKLKCMGGYIVIFVMFRNSYYPALSCR
jgi:hypothetical protein